MKHNQTSIDKKEITYSGNTSIESSEIKALSEPDERGYYWWRRNDKHRWRLSKVGYTGGKTLIADFFSQGALIRLDHGEWIKDETIKAPPGDCETDLDIKEIKK